MVPWQPHEITCDTPKITRHWKRLGAGAMWVCSCGKVYVIEARSNYETRWLAWRQVADFNSSLKQINL